MSEIVKANRIPALSVGKFIVTKTGLILDGEPEWEEWEAFFNGMKNLGDFRQWNIGDALTMVEIRHGEAAEQLTSEFPENEYNTLRKWRYVAENIKYDLRRSNLGFQHHEYVAPMESAEQDYWLSEAEINEWTVSDLRKAIKEAKKPEAPPLPEDDFTVIYADPPWQFDNTGFEQSAASHYSTMATEAIAQLPIPEGMVLFLWATAAMLEDALYVMKEWGYKYKTHMVWIKNKGPSIGWYLKTRHEILLIGVKEHRADFYVYSLHPETKPVSWHNFFSERHSSKPHEFYEIIENMYEGPYLELFARNERDNWTSWGNEI